MNIFVTGTDTDCGKTWVSSALLRAFAARGYRVLGMKPVASGATRVNGVLRSDDVEQLRSASNVSVPAEQQNPYLFEPPVSPHIAAAAAGVEIDPERILAAYRACAAVADIVVVEGVGGWRVPLGPGITVADLARALGLPVVLVVGVRLGCINHALLSAEAIAASGQTLCGWVANMLDPRLLARDAVLETLSRDLQHAPLGVVEFDERNGLGAAAAALVARGGGTF